MKARDWTFEGYLPDREDIEAEGKSREAFWNANQDMLLAPLSGKRAAVDTYFHCFVSGFNRGVAWALAKYGVEVPDRNVPGRNVVYLVGTMKKNNEYGMIGGPFYTEKETLEFEPTTDYPEPTFLLRVEKQGEEFTTEILYRWHPTLGWKSRKRSGGMERTT